MILEEEENTMNDITFEEYVKKAYRINIRDKVQPMLRVRPLYKGRKYQLTD